jgi:hypothetical protein
MHIYNKTMSLKSKKGLINKISLFSRPNPRKYDPYPKGTFSSTTQSPPVPSPVPPTPPTPSAGAFSNAFSNAFNI